MSKYYLFSVVFTGETVITDGLETSVSSQDGGCWGEKCSEVHIQLWTLLIEPSGARSALQFAILLMETH